MALDEIDLDALVSEAAAILDAAARPFVEGHRADSAVQKKGNDFATEVDLAIERQVVEALNAKTGIEVHGEEFGGADVDSPLVWVLDPIDGTFNYAAGSPMAAILLGLVRDGEPVAGLTWVPFTGERFTAVVGKPLRSNGVEQPRLQPSKLADSIVGISTFNVDSRGRVPGRYRLAVIENLSRKCSRMRMHGATGIDLAYTAAGILGGAISFGAHVWDHAAGVALVRAAGGVVTDLDGSDWTTKSRSALVAAPGVHGELLDLLQLGRRSGGLLMDPKDLAVRIIPCLDVDDGRVVKGVNFENLRDAGDPVELAATYDAEGADELTFLDVTASSSGRATMLEVVKRTAEQVFIPLTVGGGVRSVADVDVLLRAGADKVSVNTAAIARPELLAELSRQFGSQCIVLSVDARTVPEGLGTDAVGLGGHHARRPARHRDRRDRMGGPRSRTRRGGDPAQLDGLRRHQGRFRPEDAAGGARRGDGAGDRQRRRGRGGTFRPGRCCRSRRRAGRQRVPLPGADHRPGQGGDGGRRDRGAE